MGVAFKYVFRAEFTDGSTLWQPDDDETNGRWFIDQFIEAEKTKTSRAIQLIGQGHQVYVDLEGDQFFFNSFKLDETCVLPDGMEWVKSVHPVLAKKAIYFRNVKHIYEPGRDQTELQYCIGYPGRILGVS